MSDYNVAPKGKGYNTLMMRAEFELDRYTEEYAAPHLEEAWAKCKQIIDTIRCLPPHRNRCLFCSRVVLPAGDHDPGCLYRLAQYVSKDLETKEKEPAMPSSYDQHAHLEDDDVDPTLPFVPTFGWALQHLQRGDRVVRPGWNGKGMFLFLIRRWGMNEMPAAGQAVLGLERLPFIAMKTADDKIVPWLASQADILAEDWEILSPTKMAQLDHSLNAFRKIATDYHGLHPDFVGEVPCNAPHTLSVDKLGWAVSYNDVLQHNENWKQQS